MSRFKKILVVDGGTRTSDDALSAELAELGFASVTASLEAADDILAMLPTPAAILLQIPSGHDRALRERFAELAARLKLKEGIAGIPVILVDAGAALRAGGYAAMIETEFGAHAVSQPEL